MVNMPDGEPIDQKKDEVSEEEKPSDSPKKPLLMVASSKPKGMAKPALGLKPGGIGGMAAPPKINIKVLEKPSCVK